MESIVSPAENSQNILLPQCLVPNSSHSSSISHVDTFTFPQLWLHSKCRGVSLFSYVWLKCLDLCLKCIPYSICWSGLLSRRVHTANLLSSRNFIFISADLIIEPGRKYSHTALDSSFHVSQAIILYTSNATGRICLFLCVHFIVGSLFFLADEDITVIVDYEGQEFILCHLDETHSQERLDLNFQKGTSISLFTRGQEYVHLTG